MILINASQDRCELNNLRGSPLPPGLEDETLLPFYIVAAGGKYGSRKHGVSGEKEDYFLNKNRL